jgi:hypothetical protein
LRPILDIELWDQEKVYGEHLQARDSESQITRDCPFNIQ